MAFREDAGWGKISNETGVPAGRLRVLANPNCRDQNFGSVPVSGQHGQHAKVVKMTPLFLAPRAHSPR
jgi:hypothetical protein